MAHNNNEWTVKSVGGKLDASNLRCCYDVAGDPNHEQIAEPLIEDELRRHSRIRASQYDREWGLAGGKLSSPPFDRMIVMASHIRYESPVTVTQTLERFSRGDQCTVTGAAAARQKCIR
jgi:hypothetical protein